MTDPNGANSTPPAFEGFEAHLDNDRNASFEGHTGKSEMPLPPSPPKLPFERKKSTPRTAGKVHYL